MRDETKGDCSYDAKPQGPARGLAMADRTAASIVAALDRQPGPPLLPFQREFIAGSFADGIDIGAQSAPRSAGKTWLLGKLAALAMTPGSPLFQAGDEAIVAAASVEQARLLAKAADDVLPPGHLRWTGLTGGSFRVSGVHVDSGSGIRVISSSGKRAMGLGAKNRLILFDEPASTDEKAGALQIQALEFSLGKLPGARLLIIGTRSPAPDGNWWPEMIRHGSRPGRFVQLLAGGDDDQWDDYNTIARANPVVRVSASLRARVLRERDEAKADENKRHAFKLWRLNHHGQAADDMLLSVVEWQRVIRRPVADRTGLPVVAVDLGATRSWSAAVAIWPSCRTEAWAVVGGVPGLEERERLDGVPAGTYQRLEEDGRLHVVEGRETSSVEYLIDLLRTEGLRPSVVLGDFFQAGRLRDACRDWSPVVTRRTRYSEGAEDIASLRELVRDHGLSVEGSSRRLLALSLAQAAVVYDSSGSARIVKRRNEASRDDVAVACSMSSGAIMRLKRRPKPRPLRSAIVGR